MLLLVLFGVLGAYQAFAEEACYGKDFTFPYFISKLMKERKVLFTPKSFFFSLGSARLVMNEGNAFDSRFSWFKFYSLDNVKLLNVTMDDEGEYSFVSSGSNRTLYLMTLSVKDCSIKKQVFYGNSYTFNVSGVEEIKYSRSFNDLEMPVTLWSRNKAIEKAGWTLKDDVLVTSRLTQKDQGFYTLRDIKQKYLEKYSIIIKEVQQNRFFNTGEDFTITFPIVGVQFSLTYEPENGVSMPVTLIHSDSGYLANSEVFEGRMELLSTGVRIRKLEAQDAGIYRLYDSDGNLALVVEVTVKTLEFADFGLNFSPELHIKAVVVVIVIFLFCCVKYCFGRKKRPTSNPVTQVYHHETTTDDQRQSQPYLMVFNQSTYSDKPLASAANQQPQASDILNPPSYNYVVGGGGDLGPSSTSETPAHVEPVHFQGSAAGGVDAPTTTLGFDCLSSDSGTQFEVSKGPNYPSAPFLSSDTPSNDVYTSDKLNFL